MKKITGCTIETNTPNSYAAPETLFVRLRGGRVEGVGGIVHTGYIVALHDGGRTVETLSGSRYAIQDPSEEDLETLREAFGQLGPKGVDGYHPETLAYLRGL